MKGAGPRTGAEAAGAGAKSPGPTAEGRRRGGGRGGGGGPVAARKTGHARGRRQKPNTQPPARAGARPGPTRVRAAASVRTGGRRTRREGGRPGGDAGRQPGTAGRKAGGPRAGRAGGGGGAARTRGRGPPRTYVVRPCSAGGGGRGAARWRRLRDAGRGARGRAGPPVAAPLPPPARLAPFVVVQRWEQLIGRSARPAAPPRGAPARPGQSAARGPRGRPARGCH